jgi:hypothetical protein
MKTLKATVTFMAIALMLASCGNSSQGNELSGSTPEPSSTESQIDLKIKDEIRNQTLAYLDHKCTPKYETRVSDLGDGIVLKMKEMYVFDEDKFGIFNQNPEFLPEDKYFINPDSTDSAYGNLAMRTTFLASAYHNSLAGLYSYIYDINPSELKSLRKNYERFRAIADRAGKKICPIAEETYFLEALTSDDLEKIQAVYDELASSWEGFKLWWIASNQFKQNVSDRISIENEEAMTPKCDEYPSDDGKYVVVRCTLPPG